MKKTVYLIAFTIFFGLVMLFTNQSKAAVVNPPLYLGIQEYRTNTDPQNMAYGIADAVMMYMDGIYQIMKIKVLK